MVNVKGAIDNHTVAINQMNTRQEILRGNMNEMKDRSDEQFDRQERRIAALEAQKAQRTGGATSLPHQWVAFAADKNPPGCPKRVNRRLVQEFCDEVNKKRPCNQMSPKHALKKARLAGLEIDRDCVF